MALKWSEVEVKPEFLSLSPLEKDMAQAQYFNEVVKPQVPEQDWGIAEKQFFADFPSAIMQKAQGIGSVLLPSTTPNVDLQKAQGVSTLNYTGKKFGQAPSEPSKSFIGEAVDTWKEGFQKVFSPTQAAVDYEKNIPAFSKEWFTEQVPKSAARMAGGLAQFPIEVLKADMALKQGNVQPAADIIKGLIHFIGRPTGAADIAESLVKEGKLIPESFTQMGEAWVSDPVGSLLAVVPFVKGGIKTIVDSGKRFKEGIKPDVKPTAPEPIKSPAEQTIETEQAKMREAAAQGLNREQQLKQTQVNAIKTGEATDILLEGKSLRSHIKEGIESGLKPEVIENNIRELLNIQYAKEPNPLNKIKALEAQKQLNKDVSGAFEEVISSEGKGQKGYAKDAEGQMQDVVSPQEPSVPPEAQKQAAPSPLSKQAFISKIKGKAEGNPIIEAATKDTFLKVQEASKKAARATQLDLAGAKTGLEGKLPVEAVKELNIKDIPEDMMVKVNVTMPKTGITKEVSRNARESLAEKKSDIETYKSLLDCLKGR